MTIAKRPLAGTVVSLSVSSSNDSASRGFPSWQVNRVTLQFVAALFGQGASVIFGHDWREDGVMEAVHGFALQMQAPVPLTAEAAQADAEPLMQNLLPWPDDPRLSPEEQEQLSPTLTISSPGLPEGLRRYDAEARTAGPAAPIYSYLRARGLTFLRHTLTEMCSARVCIGGPRTGSQGRYPGLVEEALLAIQSNRPLYLISLLGGASEQLVSAVEGAEMPGDFCAPSGIEQVYRQPPVYENNLAGVVDRTIDRAEAWNTFAAAGNAGIARINGLSPDENATLLRTPVIEEAIELVLTGLSRIRRLRLLIYPAQQG